MWQGLGWAAVLLLGHPTGYLSYYQVGAYCSMGILFHVKPIGSWIPHMGCQVAVQDAVRSDWYPTGVSLNNARNGYPISQEERQKSVGVWAKGTGGKPSKLWPKITDNPKKETRTVMAGGDEGGRTSPIHF